MKEAKDFLKYSVVHEGLFPASHRGVLGRAIRKAGNAKYQVFESEGQKYKEPIYIDGVKQEEGLVVDVPPGMMCMAVYTTRRGNAKFWQEYRAMAMAREERILKRREKNRRKLDEASSLGIISNERNSVTVYSSVGVPVMCVNSEVEASEEELVVEV